jgi:hypothetical protein
VVFATEEVAVASALFWLASTGAARVRTAAKRAAKLSLVIAISNFLISRRCDVFVVAWISEYAIWERPYVKRIRLGKIFGAGDPCPGSEDLRQA